MAECECLKGCPFFNDMMADFEGMASLFKKRYCSGISANCSKCARYQVFKSKGREAVPKDLYPNQIDRAQQLLSTS